MSEKKANSGLPSDTWTPSDGMNYGLDGFFHDMDYGSGPQEAARLPEARGLSQLPGEIVSSESPFDFGDVESALVLGDPDGQDTSMPSMASAFKEATISNLDWLDDAIINEPDPTRLPIKQNLNSIPELEEAWGAQFRTDGVNDLIPNKALLPYAPTDKSASRYQNEDPKYRVRDAIRMAHRLSSVGTDMATIRAKVAEYVGLEYMPLCEKGLKRVARDHGVEGRVFVRASAFPGILNGKWDKVIKKKCANALYILADTPKTKEVDNFLGKRVVSKVPWKEAAQHFAPRFAQDGRDDAFKKAYKKASKSKLKKGLKAAFLHAPEVVQKETHFQTHITPSERVSSEEAWSSLKEAAKKGREVITLYEREQSRKRRAMLVRLAKWVKSGSLSRDDAQRLGSSKASPDQVLETAANLIRENQTKSANYSGHAYQGNVSREQVWARLRKHEGQLRQAAIKKVDSDIRKMASAGLITDGQASQLLKSNLSIDGKYKAVASLVSHRSRFSVEIPKAEQARAYEGKAYREHYLKKTARSQSERLETASDAWSKYERKLIATGLSKMVQSGLLTEKQAKRLIKSSSDPLGDATELIAKQASQAVQPVSLAEKKDYAGHKYVAHQSHKRALDKAARHIPRVLRFASQQMSEGMIGKDLDYLLTSNFASDVLTAASHDLVRLRDRHEGLAGHLYVDASAYASKSGTTGCDKGALKHRTNGLKFVLAMDRCKGCVFANAEGVCQKYNKPLMHKMPKEAADLQQRALKAADATDAEVTASLFAPSFDEGEYALQNDALNSFEFESGPQASLDGFSFGGIDLTASESVPTTSVRDYGSWFVKQATVTALSPFSAMLHVVLESTETREVRTLTKQLDSIPGKAVDFKVSNFGGEGAEMQRVRVSAQLDASQSSIASQSTYTDLQVDSMAGDWAFSGSPQWTW